ncbi:hypothetical protein A1Q1_03688 [Trichosporon asahii var. asahii CBS 2479]|uniref:Uncharacterized protein n=1 Tax=Trichosporon asahii var. asahii (strain ATCC 90039 / CBS 2479 / JCM 2466 / KCTC 7840 / NBRC 103889/ NCYC 2677 / UAMH 7654) TaxID=1186058 RepID=J5TSM6_TRIAS|nr:hypothetical protein A1Q1_03688 [Trichosporon asahii var. asahii CBS 2479]EJT52556.1 hypothetical protein A1Q1_03688 [Trichosporon asahii var. asahii CBS 2479]
MVTSALLFFAGDSIAQFGIEGRSLPFTTKRDPAAIEEQAAVDELRQHEGVRAGLQSSGGATAAAVIGEDGDDTKWDPYRAARLIFYGGTIFAPLAHNWLNLLQRVQLSTKFRTIATRVFLDQALWGPFVVGLFWSTNGILEGRSPADVYEKVKYAFLPVYSKSVMVFGPTAIISFTFVPLQHRLLVGQTVGLGWNTYISYLNHVNNKKLAAASRELESAHREEDGRETHTRTDEAERALKVARERREKLLSSQGGGSTGVGTRMGP